MLDETTIEKRGRSLKGKHAAVLGNSTWVAVKRPIKGGRARADEKSFRSTNRN